MIVMINSFIGIHRITQIIRKRCNQLNKPEIYKEMMHRLATIGERNIGKAKLVINEYGSKVGVILYDGDKPEPNKSHLQVSNVIAKGKLMKTIIPKLFVVPEDVDLDRLVSSDEDYYQLNADGTIYRL